MALRVKIQQAINFLICCIWIIIKYRGYFEIQKVGVELCEVRNMCLRITKELIQCIVFAHFSGSHLGVHHWHVILHVSNFYQGLRVGYIIKMPFRSSACWRERIIWWCSWKLNSACLFLTTLSEIWTICAAIYQWHTNYLILRPSDVT
jgi:hypothetical protein